MAKYYTSLSYVYIVFNVIYLTSSSPNMVLPCVSWGRLIVPVGAFKNLDFNNTRENISKRKLFNLLQFSSIGKSQTVSGRPLLFTYRPNLKKSFRI